MFSPHFMHATRILITIIQLIENIYQRYIPQTSAKQVVIYSQQMCYILSQCGVMGFRPYHPIEKNEYSSTIPLALQNINKGGREGVKLKQFEGFHDTGFSSTDRKWREI